MEDTNPTGAPPAQPSGAPASAVDQSDDAMINEIAQQAQLARMKDLEAKQTPKPAEKPKEEPAEAKGEEDNDAEEPEPAKKPAKEAEPEGDYADVDKLSAEDRLEQAAEALEAGDLKKALRLALKVKPEALKFDAGKFAAGRQAQARERQKVEALAAKRNGEIAAREQAHAAKETALTQREHKFQVEVNQWIERLKPYEVYYNAEQAWKADGDPKHLVTIIEGLTGKKYNDAQQIILKGERQDPRFSRMQAELEQMRRERQQEREEAQRIRQAEEQRRQQEDQQRQQQMAVQARANDIATIKKALGDHEVTKLPRYEERVYKVLERFYDPNLKSPTISIEQAAKRVLRAEQKRVESSPFYVKPVAPAVEDKPPKAATPRPALRKDSQNNGAQVEELSTEELIQDIARQAQRARMQAGKGTQR